MQQPRPTPVRQLLHRCPPQPRAVAQPRSQRPAPAGQMRWTTRSMQRRCLTLRWLHPGARGRCLWLLQRPRQWRPAAVPPLAVTQWAWPQPTVQQHQHQRQQQRQTPKQLRWLQWILQQQRLRARQCRRALLAVAPPSVMRPAQRRTRSPCLRHCLCCSRSLLLAPQPLRQPPVLQCLLVLRQRSHSSLTAVLARWRSQLTAPQTQQCSRQTAVIAPLCSQPTAGTAAPSSQQLQPAAAPAASCARMQLQPWLPSSSRSARARSSSRAASMIRHQGRCSSSSRRQVLWWSRSSTREQQQLTTWRPHHGTQGRQASRLTPTHSRVRALARRQLRRTCWTRVRCQPEAAQQPTAVR
jgi:hypothetical protein